MSSLPSPEQVLTRVFASSLQEISLLYERMPRTSTTCRAAFRSDDKWCDHPAKKKKCIFEGESPVPRPGPPLPPQPVALDSQSSAPSLRDRKTPQRYDPVDLWRRPLPLAPQRFKVQKRQVHDGMFDQSDLDQARAEGRADALKEADGVVVDIKGRLAEIAAALSRSNAELVRAQAALRKAEAGKRQRTLHSFFAKSLPLDARACPLLSS